MERYQIIAITGRNGSGKTQYVDQMRKRLASDKVRYVAFHDAYGTNTDRAYYLQLRWNQHDIDHETPTVGQLLERAYLMAGDDTPQRRQTQQQLYNLFGMSTLLEQYIIILSSGELRKFQLLKTLLANPQILILDNPFIGLDAETRQQLKGLLLQLAQQQGITIYLVLAKSDDLPDYVTQVIHIDDNPQAPRSFSSQQAATLLALPTPPNSYQEAPVVIDMRHVSIRYGERTILRDLNWTVKQGERWVLSGQNGSGKSTLLSLVCADNPQSYACDISLFGRQRGTGESIWDIKRHIGYVSPEMHRSYQRNLPALQIVASGLKDTVGLYVKPNNQEKETCRWWLRLFGIETLAERPFLTLSSGEQRLVLVARAFVKDPELLILDEPLHGLDDDNRQLVRKVIDTFCQRPGKTLIMVSHYMEELPTCINKKLYLNKEK